MNLVRASGRLFRMAPVLVKSTPSVRGAIYLDRDWMPGAYPKTEEERLAAAKKYNLLPEEYEPYDPEKWEMALGDYPKLPNLHFADKDSDYAWDYIFHRHNYSQPLHAYLERYYWWAPEMHEDEYIPPSHFLITYIFAFSFVYISMYLFHKYERITVFKRKHTPKPGVIHYHYPNSNLDAYEEHSHHHH